jgi:hypothetical protein
MRNDLPISGKKKFKYSITFTSWDEESLEMGETDNRGYEIEDDIDAIGDILYKANTTYGIYYPLSFGGWESTEPEEDRDFWEKGIRKYYALHITNEDGTEISQEENDFITYLLSDGRYEIDKFRDYAVGGIVLGSIALGVGALITYFYFKGKKGGKGKKVSTNNSAKSITHTIKGKDRKYPIKDAWRKEHSLENKSEEYEIAQADRYEMGGDASKHYHEIEYGEGGVARAKEIITKKIGLSEQNANFLTSQSEKFAIWLADSIIQLGTNSNLYGTKNETIEAFNKSPYLITELRQRIRLILDWLQHPVTPKQNLRELSFAEAEQKAREWHQELQVLGGDIDFTEPEKNTIIKKYPKNSDGIEYYWVFIPSNYCDLESSRMGHCGRTGYGNNLISLRSVKPYGKGHTLNDSHITIAYGVTDGLFYQVKGKKNSKPAEKYFPYIYDLIKSILDGEINQRFKDENDESIKVVEYLLNEQKKIEDEILPHINFSFSSPSSTEYKFLKGELNRGDFEADFYRYLSSQIPVYDNFRIIHKLNEKLNVVRNNREYEELLGEINRLRDEAYTYYIENVVDKYKEIIRLNNAQKQAENVLMYFNFEGFGSEYGDEEDYGFDDMTKEELRELYQLKPTIFNDSESIFAIYDAGVITAEELKTLKDGNQEFDTFGNQMKLYERGIISEQPSTIFELNYGCDEVYNLLDISRDFSDDIVEKILCGDFEDLTDSWSYYYDNPSDLVDNINKENTDRVIDEIVRITGYEKSVVEENGIGYYLNGEDENFPSDDFDNIIRVLASAQDSADNSDYYNYLYDNLKSSLEELGEVHSLNDEGVKMTIDLSNSMSLEEIAEAMERYEFSDVADLFYEILNSTAIDKPRLRIDDRYNPYGSTQDFNDYISDSDLESFAKGGSLRPKNTKLNTKTKIKNMKPSQRKLAQGGNIQATGISKEDYFLVVQNWVYFTFNYPTNFVKDAFNLKHLEEKFSSSYARYGSVGVLMSFWANLDGNNRRILALWIKNNYFNSSSDKTKLQSISDDNYAKIITHWNMFCFNFPIGFIQNVYGENTSHFEMKWVRAYESAGSTGAVNKFFTEMSSNNQELLTDWVYDNYKGMTFAGGGDTGKGKVDKKGKIEISDGAEGRKIAKRIIVETDDAGDVVTYDLEVGLFADRKKGYFIVEGTWDEVMEEGTEDEYTEEQYFYQEGGLWIEGGKVYDYDGVYELEPKLKPLMSALNLNSSEIFADGGETGNPEWAVTITNEDGDTFDWVGFAKDEDEALYFAEQEAGFESVETGINMITDKKGETMKYAKGGMFGESAKLEFIGDAYASDEMADELRKKLKIKGDSLANKDVISFAYTDYGGDFLDKVAIAYFSEYYPENIIKENSGWGGENAFVFGEPAKEWIETTEDYPLGFEDFESYYYEKENEQQLEDFDYFLDEISRDYSFDKDAVLDWLLENRSGYYGITTQGLDFSWEDLTEELVNEGLIEKTDEDEYAEGGEAGELVMVSGEAFYVTDSSAKDSGRNFDTLSDTFYDSKDDFEDLLGSAILTFSFFVNVKNQYNIIQAIYDQMQEEGEMPNDENLQIVGFEVDSFPKNDFESELPYDIEDDEDEYASGGKIKLYDVVAYNKATDYDNKINGKIIADSYTRKVDAIKTMQKFKNSYPFIEIKEYMGNDPYKYAGGGSVKGIKKKAEKLLEDSITYIWKSTDMGSGWYFMLENPNGGVLDTSLVLDIFDGDEYVSEYDDVEDWNSLSKADKKYYFDQYKEELLQVNYDYFKDEMVINYLDEFVEYLQRDSDDNFAEGGGIGQMNNAKYYWKSFNKKQKIDFLVGAGYSKSVANDLSNEDWDSLEIGVHKDLVSVLMAEGGEAGYSKKERVIDYYYQNDVFDDYETYGLSEDDLNNEDKIVKAIIKYHGLENPENVDERFETLLGDDDDDYAEGGDAGDDIEQNFKVGNIVELSESGWDNENYHDFFEDVDNVKIVITDVYKNQSEHQGFDTGLGMALYSTKRLDNNEIVPFDLYDYELEYSSKGEAGEDDNDDDDYAEGGEVEDWMEEALASLIEETGSTDIEISYVSNDGKEFYATDNDVEYRVFKTEDDAEETAIQQVREDLEENPEYFNQDWLMNYIDGRDFFEEALNEMNQSYVDDIESEGDSKYANRLIAELVENGLMDEADAKYDYAQPMADDLKSDYVALLTEDKMNEGNDGLDYFIFNFGEEETYTMVRDNNLIDIDEASKDAVNVDGIGHFLSSYDGETLYLSDDCVAYRIN